MASVLSGVLKTLTGSRDAVLSSAEVFPLLDVEQLATELRLVARGQEDGQANLPRDEAESSAETDIRAEIVRRATKARDDYQTQLDLYDGRIRGALVSADLRTAIEAAGERALSDFKVQATDDLSRLDPYHRDLIGRQAELKAFQAEHNLRRLPREPKRKSLKWALICLVFVIEAYANGILFAEGSPMGLIGGVMQAAMLSFLNIAAALLCALGLAPYVRHRSKVFRICGVLAVGLYIAYALALNLGIGHFRDLFAGNEGHVELTALWSRLAHSPLGFSDAKSLILVALGIAFSIFVWIDAAGLNDPYPGYGSAGRRSKEAIVEYNNYRGLCVKDLRIRRDEAINEMSQVIEEVRRKEHDLNLAIKGRERLRQRHVAFVEQLNETQLRLMQRYRQANQTTRTNAVPSRWTALVVTVAPVDSVLSSGDLTTSRDVMRHVIERMEFFIRAISKEYDTQAERYPPVGNLVESTPTAECLNA
jgi:hypothetical protein